VTAHFAIFGPTLFVIDNNFAFPALDNYRSVNFGIEAGSADFYLAVVANKQDIIDDDFIAGFGVFAEGQAEVSILLGAVLEATIFADCVHVISQIFAKTLGYEFLAGMSRGFHFKLVGYIPALLPTVTSEFIYI
jgi:hypothetical protein